MMRLRKVELVEWLRRELQQGEELQKERRSNERVIRDVLQFAKTELMEELHPKLAKNKRSYLMEKKRFLNKIIRRLNLRYERIKKRKSKNRFPS